MVVLALVLGSVLGGVVINKVQVMSNPPAPQVDMTIRDADVDYRPTDGADEGFVKVRHLRGDKIDTDELEILIRTDTEQTRVFSWTNGNGTNYAGNGTWTITHNGASLQTQSEISRDDEIVISYQDDGQPPPDVPDDKDYVVMLIHPESGNQIASATVSID